MTGAADAPVVPFASADEWETWLEQHHEGPDGVWMKAKVNAGNWRGVPSHT